MSSNSVLSLLSPSTVSKSRSSSQRTQPGRRPIAGSIAPGRYSHKPEAVLAVVLVGFIFLQYFLPLRTAIQIGGDEGFELAKATVFLNGYKPYSEVWNDTPPLHTFLIAQILKHLSPSVLGPRLVTSVFAAILLTSVFFIGFRVGGLLVAAVTSALLIASPGFLELSASCMVEIPALAPAVAGLCVLLLGRQSKWHLPEILSGVLFAVSFQIKFINVILLPLVALIVWIKDHKTATFESLSRAEPTPCPSREGNISKASGHRLQPQNTLGITPLFPPIRSLAVFVTSLAIGFAAIHLLIGEGSFWLQLKQAWASHFASTKSFEYGSPADHPFDWSIFLKNWDTTIPAVLGIVICLQQLRRTRAAMVPLAWFALGLIVFGIHKPWWPYYYVHNAAPLCLCAAIGLGAVWGKINARRTPAWVALFAVYALAAGAWMTGRVYLQISNIRHSPQTYSSLVLTEIERFRPFTKFMYADDRIYSFHAGIPMPPKLVLVSLKRLWSGDMTNAKIAAELQATRPGAILLANDTRAVPFADLLTAEYRLVYQDDKHRLYAQKAVIAQVKY